MTNRLAGESSPYLQQHAGNPVDWYPWGAEAFAAARDAQKPVLLSIGYAACHWCHVMAHESFEDPATARLMNDLFVNVKVDREERPDVDAIYMQAVQAITGHGGWPMTMFLTPEGVPFFGGTYWPPDDRHGMPSFQRILVSVSEAWRTRRDEVLKGAETLRGIYAATEGDTAAGEGLSAAQWDAAVKSLSRWYDAQHGGFGRAPKFPQPQMLELLLLHWARTGDAESLRMVQHSFTHMVRGGLHDQLGGGFHRYCVDAIWLVPHFEKMLYDNALLARLAVHLWQATRDETAREVALRTFAWLQREMTDARGGWYSSLDADSDGHEGTFYVWTLDELREVLGEADAVVAAEYWGVTAAGNFEGSSVLTERHLPQRTQGNDGERLGGMRERLLDARERRVRPMRDEKVLAGWNALMLRAMAEAARAFGDEELGRRAVAAARFLRAEMVRDGRVRRTWRDGVAKIDGFLEDHAALALAFVAVYQLTFEREWLDAALALHAVCVRDFWDEERGAWFDTAHDAEPLVTRPRDVTDNAIPAGQSLAVELDLTVAVLRDDRVARSRAEYVLATMVEPMQRSPLAFGHLLCAADLAVRGAVEVAIAGSATSPAFRALAQAVAAEYVPSAVVVGGQGAAVDGLPLMEGRAAGRTSHSPRGQPIAQAFVCRNYACALPVAHPDALREQLRAARA